MALEPCPLVVGVVHVDHLGGKGVIGELQHTFFAESASWESAHRSQARAVLVAPGSPASGRLCTPLRKLDINVGRHPLAVETGCFTVVLCVTQRLRVFEGWPLRALARVWRLVPLH